MTADAGVGDEIAFLSQYCTAKGKGSPLDGLLRQIKPLAAALVDLKNRKCFL